MDIAKSNALKAELARQAEPQVVSIERFFDGNDDLGSIACNLIEHPGIEAFRSAFASLRLRPDVRAIYAQISELDRGKDSWPFTDRVIVVGSIPADELRKALAHLEPDEVGPVNPEYLSSGLSERERRSALVAWWD